MPGLVVNITMKKLTLKKLCAFILKREHSMPSNMQFGFDLESVGLTQEMLGNLRVYDVDGFPMYCWDLKGSELERTHLLVEFGNTCFIVPAMFEHSWTYPLKAKKDEKEI